MAIRNSEFLHRDTGREVRAAHKALKKRDLNECLRLLRRAAVLEEVAEEKGSRKN